MKATAKKVLNAALRLPEVERAALVEELLAELDGSDEDADAAWAAEIERRTREIDAGTVKPVSWATVRRRIQRQVRAPR
jgi:putative addiction module component (TIGR02574 family)